MGLAANRSFVAAGDVVDAGYRAGGYVVVVLCRVGFLNRR